MISFLLAAQVAVAAAAPVELPIHSVIQTGSDDLTTEKVWTHAPEELNPQRSRWVVEREVGLGGLAGITSEPGKFGVRADVINSTARIHVRAPGAWYRPLGEFSCESRPDHWFGTQEGARLAAQVAASEWHQLMDRERGRLAFLLGKVSEASSKEAVASAQRVFKAWVQALGTVWTEQARTQAREEEWKHYLAQARQVGDCPRKLPAATGAPWSKMMEPAGPTPRTQLLSRMPVKLWNGLYTVRMSAGFGDKTLNGRFVVDTGSAVSVVSPDWLKGQGVNPALVELPGVPPHPVHWSGGRGIARRAVPFLVTLGGHAVPPMEFRVMPTELFAPPRFMASCCDGIIGSDILRQFAVEFVPGPPAELLLFERKGFSLGTETPWFEVASSPIGEPVSTSCSFHASNNSSSEAIPGVRWDTGSEEPVAVHSPWKGAAGKPGIPGRLICDQNEVASAVPWEHADEQSGMHSRVPGVSVGVSLLNRGNFILDLAHGRIWIPKKTIAAAIPGNRTGLSLDYGFARGDSDRILKVVSIDRGSRASKLLPEGLKPGTVIAALDSVPADELDIGEVERRLSGAYGPKVVLQWKSGASVRTVELATR